MINRPVQRVFGRGERELVAEVRKRVAESLSGAPVTVLVAVSGGQDSTCLLDAIDRTNHELHVCYVNHGLRAEGSDEARLVAHDAARRNRGFTEVNLDVKSAIAGSGESIAVAARRLRRAALREVALRIGATWIALGHTLDDQVETILMHILRGAGIRGMAGMRQFDPPILRPLLAVSRQETELYCKAVGLDFVSDPSNEDISQPRNRIRHRVIPDLEKLYPGTRANLKRLAGRAESASDFLLDVAEAFSHVTGSEGAITSVTNSVDPALKYAYDLLTQQSSQEVPPDPVVPDVLPQTRLSVPGLTDAGQSRFAVAILPADAIAQQRVYMCSRLDAFLDADAVGMELHIRTAKKGERVQLLGRPGSRKLQDVWTDAHVPRSSRWRVPVVATADDEIVFIPGIGVAQRARISSNTSRVLLIRSSPALD